MDTIKQKLVHFTVYNFILQGIPLAIALLPEYQTHASIKYNGSFLLLAIAWLSIPNYISTAQLSERKRSLGKILSVFATFIGIILIIIFAIAEYALTTNPDNPHIPYLNNWKIALLTGSSMLIGAYLFIVLSHKSLLHNISLKLLWAHQAQFAGFYCSKKEGFFEKFGLNVKFEETNPNSQPQSECFPSSSDFAILSAPDVIIQRSKNLFIKSICILMENENIIFISRSKDKINGIHDFIGKTVGVREGFEEYYLLMAMLKTEIGEDQINIIDVLDENTKTKICPNSVNIIFIKEATPKPFIKKQIDIWPGHIAVEPIEIMTNGEPDIDLIFPSSFGIHVSGGTLVTSGHLINTKPETVNAFYSACKLGWEFAREDSERALKNIFYYMKHSKYCDSNTGLTETQKNIQRESLNHMVGLIFQEKEFPKKQSAKHWQEMITVLKLHGAINRDIDAESLIW